MILLTGLYRDPDPRRREELRECLRRNIELDTLNEIHLFVEDPFADSDPDGLVLLNSRKIHLVAHGRRVKFRDLFDYANQSLEGRCVLIANADIFFDDTLKCLDGYDLSGKLLCLSRWDVQADGSATLFEHPGSQDAWIFQAPILAFNCDFYLGVLGCDNRLAWEAEQAGLIVSNPSRTVRANHLHLSMVRHYVERERLVGPAQCVPATPLESPYPSSLGPPPAVPSATVAFNETMGYTIASLESGASSHNNDQRPFTAIPEPLAGLQFTQVVAMSVSPVEVDFLTPGKLYVLVGNDWNGYYPATAWLSEQGYREDLPLVRTQSRTAFEVWSLVAEAGQRFVLPTQVMLAAHDLVRNNGDALLRTESEKSI